MSVNDLSPRVEYREIPSHPGFRFGSDASVWTRWRKGRKDLIADKPLGDWRRLKPSPRPNGHSWVFLGCQKTTKPHRLDSLICEAFHGERPAGTECQHRDGDRTNCSADNLYWGISDEFDPMVEYRQIDRCEGYQFGSDGSVWSAWGTGFDAPGDVWRRMWPTALDSGHLQVAVKWDGEMRRFGVHHLICIAFHGPCPDSMECCHFPDRDPTNNRAENLRWGTPKDNSGDALQHGSIARGEDRWNAKLADADVIEARRLYAEGSTTVDLAARYGVSHVTIGRAIDGSQWGHLPGAVPLRPSGRKLSDAQIIRARTLYAAGATSTELASIFDVSVPLILRAIKGEVGGDLPDAVSIRRDRHKLTDEQEAELARLCDEGGWTLQRLAEKFGVHRQTVANILARR